jgi:hypothetical protein
LLFVAETISSAKGESSSFGMKGDPRTAPLHDGLSMKSFSPLSGSEGPRREFKITWGLRAGYGTRGRIYDLEEAIRAAHRWMRERHARGKPFLSGMFTRGEVVYAGSEGDAAHDREPVAIFTGEVLPLYAGDLDDETIRMLLNELASEIGRTLEQEEVHVGYRDRTWTLERGL